MTDKIAFRQKLKSKEKENVFCCYCEKATILKEFETYICKKNGVVSYNFCCKKFSFDPLKKIPARTGKKLKQEFTSEDFSF